MSGRFCPTSAFAVMDPIRPQEDSAAAGPRGVAHSVVDGGEPAKLIQRITADEKGGRMPPVYSGLKLTDGGD